MGVFTEPVLDHSRLSWSKPQPPGCIYISFPIQTAAFAVSQCHWLIDPLTSSPPSNLPLSAPLLTMPSRSQFAEGVRQEWMLHFVKGIDAITRPFFLVTNTVTYMD